MGDGKQGADEEPYDRLRARFQEAVRSAAEGPLVLSFDEVGALLGGLPADAYSKKQWWTSARQPHVVVWRREGWAVDAVGFRMQRAAFKRL